MELVSAAREYEIARSRAVAGRIRRSAGAAVGRGQGAGPDGEPEGHDDDPALGQGPGVPDRRARRPRGGPVPALAVARGRGGARRGAAALLRRHHPRAKAAGADQRGPPAGVRRVSEHRAVAVHRRDSGGSGRAGVPVGTSSPVTAAAAADWAYRAESIRAAAIAPEQTRGSRRQGPDAELHYEEEDQTPGLRPARASTTPSLERERS